MQDRKKYYINFITLCVGGLLVAYGLSQVHSRFFSTGHFWIPTVFFSLTTLGINALLTNGDKQSKEFIFKTLAMSMARLLVCMIVVFIYSLINKPQTLAFACHFMIQYALFTVFEIVFLLKYIKQTN
jgi:hypothetical protein